jgi:microsomal dipeptidase-like Zn-dependent dipeptidase
VLGRTHRLAILLIVALTHCSGKNDDPDIDLVGSGIGKGQVYVQKQKKRQRTSQSALVIDLAEDLVFRRLRDNWTLTFSKAHVNVEKLKAGGVNLILSALQTMPGKELQKSLDRAIAVNRELVAGTDGAMEIVSSFKAAKNAAERGIISVMLLMEGADALEGRLHRIPELKKQGLAAVGVVAGKDNAFAGTSGGAREKGGLTDEGRDLLEACRDAEIAVDVTHASYTAFWDILVEQSGAVVASHTAARALRDHARNLDDLQILALARYGGIMGLMFNPDFLKPGMDEAASLKDVVAHVMHLKEIGALNAVGLGTDFGGVNPPSGLEDISKLPALAKALEQQGLSDDEIKGVFGGNTGRFFEEIERDRGALKLTTDEILRPIPLECDAVTGEIEGSAALVCNGYVLDQGPGLPPAGRQKLRIREMTLEPVRLELFGEPGTPWQVEGQNLEGKILFTRVVALDNQGQGTLNLPSGRNLTRLFCSPTRQSALREAVVWGR